jgi:hypothetical protein
MEKSDYIAVLITANTAPIIGGNQDYLDWIDKEVA